MSRPFLICPEPVRELTAGVGTRFLRLARLLADEGHRVTLAVPNDLVEAGPAVAGVEVVRAEPERVGAQADGHDWVLLHGHLGNFYLHQRDDLPVVVDLYDPFLVENLHYAKDLGLEPYTTDHATFRLQLARGDLFLCSSGEQRLYYLGWLSALGRLNPYAIEGDPRLERLLVEVPFGCDEVVPPPAPPREQVLPGVGPDAPVLYFGGLYQWYDPMALLEALPEVLRRHPRAVVVFVDHPHPELSPRAVERAVRGEAEARGWLGRQVRFAPWRPWDRRFELAQVADLAVVTHRPGVETDLSLRTRLVDLLWLGVPVVATAGGTMGRVVEETGAGAVVAPGDSGAVAAAVVAMLDDPRRRREAGEAGRRWASERTWSRVAAPLLEYARAPWRDPHRDRFAALAPGAVTPRDSLGRRLGRRLRRLGLAR